MINLSGLDFEKGLDVFDGEMDDYVSALQSFVKNIPETINKLRAVTEESLSEYAINIHGLKSTSGWICAEGIREKSAELEALAKSGDFSAVAAQNGKFLNDADAFINELKTALENIHRS
jgi:HPt (histidine-containing phosphotransfer) domain-containing protein